MTPSPSTGLRWGIVATGGIAHSFAADLRTASLAIGAVSSRSRERAEAFAAEFEIPAVHGSAADLFAADTCDIAYIAAPHPFHAELAIAAIESGKHVLVEKPFTLTGAEADAVLAAAQRSDVLVMEAMWTRYLPHMVRVRELVRSGALGEVRAVSASHLQSLPTDPAHRLNALELGGGALLDLGIYPLSFAWDVLGAPTELVARGRLGATGADTEVAIAGVHASGAVSSSISSSRAAGPNTATIAGTDGFIAIDPVWYTPTRFEFRRTDGELVEEFRAEVAGRGMQYQALAAERLVARGLRESDEQPLAESVAIMHALDDIRAQLGVRYPGEN